MNLHPLTVTPASSFARPAATEAPVTQLQGRCTSRVCYAQKSTTSGDRVYGHFSMSTAALAESLDRQLPSLEFTDAPSADQSLHRWVRDHDRSDESDDAVTPLPASWSGLEHAVEELFSEKQTRVFCTCCNRNVAPRDVRLERASRRTEGISYRYFCPEEHLLLAVQTAQVIAATERHAA